MNYLKYSLVIFFCLILLGCTIKNNAKIVEYIEVNPTSSYDKIYTGIVKAFQVSELSFQSEGRIIFMPYAIGDYVKKGQVLARLDGSLYKIKKSEELEKLNEYNLKFERQKRYYSRMDILHKEGAISDNDWENAYYDMKTTNQQIKTQKEKIAYLDKEINYNIILAPYDGFITDRIAEIGELAQIGTPIIKMMASDTLQVEFAVDENVLNRLKISDKLNILILDKNYIGKIVYISKTSVDDGGYIIKVALDKNYPELKEGMSAKIHIAIENKSIQIPLGCILEEEDKKYIYKIVDIHNNIGYLEKYNIETGRINKGNVEIKKGVTNDDLIACSDVFLLYDKEKVRL